MKITREGTIWRLQGEVWGRFILINGRRRRDLEQVLLDIAASPDEACSSRCPGDLSRRCVFRPGHAEHVFAHGDHEGCWGKGGVPSVAECERAFGVPAARWVDNCYAVVAALLKYELVDGIASEGEYRGLIADGSYFAELRSLGYMAHGWITCADGTVVDATRWVFENVKPYIYCGPSGGLYLQQKL